ncbi:hypothetical protein DLM75_05490 [Leptospira stimsonii]|uniref:Uncharacterized protein n=1 Tax=Leptospira stimsonii TaxID=2202203 RepID=A0A396ZEF1_9LEPT|nr:hypothetical protein DLM75_05490 [Leptospira stimsonii]
MFKFISNGEFPQVKKMNTFKKKKKIFSTVYSGSGEESRTIRPKLDLEKEKRGFVTKSKRSFPFVDPNWEGINLFLKSRNPEKISLREIKFSGNENTK